jgi:ectoine hydroxylase
MKITPEQRNSFDKDGYLFFPSLFSPEEIQNLLAVVPELYQ